MWDWVMARRRQVVIGASALLAVLVVAPLVWWQFFGPQRFDDLQLGVAPEDLPAASDAPPADDLDDEFSFLDAGSASAQVDLPEPLPLPPLALSPTTRVTLIFSVGSDGMTREEARRLRVNDLGDRGSDRLTDSIMLLVSDTATREAAMLSIPRDLYMGNRGRRINATFASQGIQAFVDDVTRASGLPIHHVVQLNFTAFATLVDAVGGVALDIAQPMADLHSSLYIPAAGCWRLDGADALAYARSRQPLTTTNGGDSWRMSSGANDFSRIHRQQGLAAAAWDQVRGAGFVRRLPDLVRLANGLTIDRGLGIDDVVDLARAFSDVAAGRVEGHILPTEPRRVAGAAVLVIDWGRVMPLYERMRSWPPSSASPAGNEAPDGDGVGAAEDGGDDASAGPTDTPAEPASPSASPSPSAAASESASPGDDAPSQAAPARAARTAGCTRGSARELPDDPQRYLAAIAAGDPPPPWEPPQPDGDPSQDPSPGQESSTDPEGSEPDGEATEGESEEPRPVPTELPTGDAEESEGEDGGSGRTEGGHT